MLGAGFCYVGSALFRSRLLLYSAGTATNVHTHIIMFLEMVMKMPIHNGSGFEKSRFIYMKMELSKAVVHYKCPFKMDMVLKKLGLSI